MRPFRFYYDVALDYSKYYCSDSERELTFEVNLPTNLGELTFKNISKWVIDHSGVVIALTTDVSEKDNGQANPPWS
jgi:hypothetical protein